MDWLMDFTHTVAFFWWCFLWVSGATIGSFLNVVIYRLPVMLERRWQHHALQQLAQPLPETKPYFNLLLPVSHCPHCQHPIAAKDNIPLLGFFKLKGKSRCCGKHISWCYPLIEGATAGLFVLAGSVLPLGIPLLASIVFLSLLLTLAIIDYRTQLLPDVLTLPLLWLGLLFNLQGYFTSLAHATIGAMSGYLSFWVIFWLFKWVTGKEALGYGDFKLLAALGAWLGWQALPNVILMATICGLLYTLIQYRTLREAFKQPLAFGPWLALSGAYHMLLILFTVYISV